MVNEHVEPGVGLTVNRQNGETAALCGGHNAGKKMTQQASDACVVPYSFLYLSFPDYSNPQDPPPHAHSIVYIVFWRLPLAFFQSWNNEPHPRLYRMLPYLLRSILVMTTVGG